MPIYEYYCPECKEKFELLRAFSQMNEATVCPKCKKSSKKIMSRCASFSKDSSGAAAPVTGGGCASCGSSGCTSCGG